MGKHIGSGFTAALELDSVETLAFFTSRKLKIFKIDKAVFIFSLLQFWLGDLIMFSLLFESWMICFKCLVFTVVIMISRVFVGVFLI